MTSGTRVSPGGSTTAREVGALSKVHEEAETFALANARRANRVLDWETKAKAARIAVAEAQSHHATGRWAELRFEVGRALPRMPHTANAESLTTEVAKMAVSGRCGTEVVQVTAPDVADVTELGVRKSDGGSVYRPPNEARYATLAQLGWYGDTAGGGRFSCLGDDDQEPIDLLGKRRPRSQFPMVSGDTPAAVAGSRSEGRLPSAHG
jgi:hypothetical protein